MSADRVPCIMAFTKALNFIEIFYREWEFTKMRLQTQPHFGEMYELRFQREGTQRALRKHPEALNHIAFTDNPDDRSNRENLTTYFETHGLAAQVSYDDVYGMKPNPANGWFTQTLPPRWLVSTNGPKVNSLDQIQAIQDMMMPSFELVKADQKDIGDHNRELIQRYLDAKVFPKKIPTLTVRYELEPMSPEEKAERGPRKSSTVNGKVQYEPERYMRITNFPDLLKQLQVEGIQRWETEEGEPSIDEAMGGVIIEDVVAPPGKPGSRIDLQG